MEELLSGCTCLWLQAAAGPQQLVSSAVSLIVVSVKGTENSMNQRPLWKCSRCEREFANRNQSHACARYTLADHLSGKTPHAVALFRRFAQLVEECGPVRILPEKTRIAFQVRMSFAAVSLRRDRLIGHVVLARRMEHSRFTRIESISPRNHVHCFCIRTPLELDEELLEWLREAYLVGEQQHLGM